MSLDPSLLAVDEATGAAVPTESRQLLLPYDDMRILNPPIRRSTVSIDLLSALSILVAQGPDRARLLTADVKGRLRTSGFVNPVTTLQQAFTGGGTSINVADSSDYYVGQLVTLVSQTAGGPSCSGMIVSSTPDIHTVSVTNSCVGQNFVVGDFLVGTPDVRVAANVFPNQISGINTTVLSGAPNPGDASPGQTGDISGHKWLQVDEERPCDSFLTSGVVQPAAASITFPAPGAGYRNVLVWFSAAALNNTAGNQTPALQVWNGAAGSGVLIYSEPTGMVPGTSVNIHRDKLRIYAALNTVLTVVWDRGVASLFESVNAGVNLHLG